MSIFDKLRGKKDVAAKETKEALINELIEKVKGLADDDLDTFLKGLGVYEEEGQETETKEENETDATLNQESDVANAEDKPAVEQAENTNTEDLQESGNHPEGNEQAEQRELNELSAPSLEQATEPVIETQAETGAEAANVGETAESEDTIKALIARIDALESELKTIREATNEDDEEDEQGYGGVSSKFVLKDSLKPASSTDKAKSKEEWREKFING